MDDVLALDIAQLKTQIKQLRQAIRYHRDQVGDYRCWLDDDLVYEPLPETPSLSLPAQEEFMHKCLVFHQMRQDEKDILLTEKRDQDGNDEDLNLMAVDDLQKELSLLRLGARQHRDIGDNKRTIEDDQKLYGLLPEKLNANWRLPEKDEFLGSCKRFYATRDPNNLKLHQW